jgi:nitrogen regulatory protein P-II 1
MVRITCFVRPHRLEAVKTAIAAVGITGMTVSDVRGCGNSPESTEWFGGEAGVVALPIRSKLMTVVPSRLAESAVKAILGVARTGRDGDGKIFLEPVVGAVRVRTKESGEAAVDSLA